jgi:hypothetical protein
MQTVYIASTIAYFMSPNIIVNDTPSESNCLGVFDTFEAAKKACIRALTVPDASRVINMFHEHYIIEERNLNEESVKPTAMWKLDYNDRINTYIDFLRDTKKNSTLAKNTLLSFVDSWNDDLDIAVTFFKDSFVQCKTEEIN